MPEVFRIDDNPPLRPKEIMDVLGVHPWMPPRWMPTGSIAAVCRIGGRLRHRADVIRVLLTPEINGRFAPAQAAKDAARLLGEGWGISQVARQFGISASLLRVILWRHTWLRPEPHASPTQTPLGSGKQDS